MLAGWLVFMAGGIRPEDAHPQSPAALTCAQIVDQMQIHDKARKDELKHWQALRHYRVEYRGFSATLAAQMDVETTYDAGSGKSFRIVSESGSKMLLDHVLKRLLESEKEAGHEQSSNALTPANYRFRLDGVETLGGRTAYVLDVEPIHDSKFLYRGKIWIDAADYAVVKIEAEPSKSPSFWVSRTLIHHVYAKTGEFWLPEQDRSETKVRVGGTAVLTIDYGTYRDVSGTAREAAAF